MAAFASLSVLGLDYVTATHLLPPGLRSHMSNLVISGVLCLSAGVLLASVGAGFWWHLLAPMIAVVVNLVVETLMTGDNIRDVADFAAGTVGAAAGFLAGVLISVVGTRSPDP